MKKYPICCVVLFCTALLLVACSGKNTVGVPASVDTPAVALADILESPGAYDGQTVVLQGVLTGLCASLCDFTYTEGGRSVTIFMGSEKAPKVPVGQPVRVTASVHKGEHQVVFTAIGVEVLPRGDST